MNIVNLIHIGDKVMNFDDLSEAEKREIGRALNEQALRHLGYKPRQEDKTA